MAEINSFLLRERIPPITLGASGVIGTAATTVDIVSNVGVTASAANLTFTLANPTDLRPGRSMIVTNTGATNTFTVYGNAIAPGQYSEFIFDGVWRAASAASGADFWRDTTAPRALPDGTIDTTQGIVHNGAVHMGTNIYGAATPHGFHHEAIVQYAGTGGLNTQTILTTIPVNSTIMPTIFIKGYAYETAHTIDLQVGLYTYNVPLNTTTNAVWSSTGSTQPTQIRAGYNGGFLELELTWPATDDYFCRYEVSAFCDGNGSSTAEMFQGWTVAQGPFGAPTTNITTVGRKFPETVPDRDVQERFTSQATTKISLVGEVRWDGFYHIMTRGTNSVEPAGHFRIDMPADGFAIPVADGTTRAVVAAVAGSTVDTGGIPLNVWDSLYYKHVPGNGAASQSANFLIVPYLANTQTNSVFTDYDDWIMIARRDDAGAFTLGTRDVVGFCGQVGRGGAITTANWQAMKQRVMGDGYFFVPGGNTGSNLSFGFTGTIRWIDGGSTSLVNSAGYVDVDQASKAVGVAIRGVNGAANRAWRLMTAAEKPEWFGGMRRGNTPILAASTTVVDLSDNETLYYVRNLNTGAGTGQWVITGYSGQVTVPVHWLPIASKQTTGGHSTTQVLLGGVQYALKSGDARYTSTNDATMDAIRRNQNVQFNGIHYCRATTATFFAGAAANGLLGGAVGTMVSWDDNNLIYGISDGYSNYGNQYTWINTPPAGTAIPVANTNSNITRVVQTIGGRRYIPLGPWEALFWIPPSYSGGSNSDAGDWVITYYGTANHHVPPSALMVAKMFSAFAGNGQTKTRVKFADGSYMQPGLSAATATLAEYDHAQGSGNWRPITIAGQTGPGMTAAVPAVAGVSQASAEYRYVTTDGDVRGYVEFDGYINVTANVPDGTVIGFIPGVQTRNPGQITPVAQRHAGNNTILGYGFVTFTNNTVGGQNGSEILLYGMSAGNVAAANGGANGAAGVVSLSGVSRSFA
jgi:hypothetical protein